MPRFKLLCSFPSDSLFTEFDLEPKGHVLWCRTSLRLLVGGIEVIIDGANVFVVMLASLLALFRFWFLVLCGFGFVFCFV